METLAAPFNAMDTHVERVKKAYPAYFDTYSQIDSLVTWLDGIPNLFCVGRNSQHRYNNIDHSMCTSFEAVKILWKEGPTRPMYGASTQKRNTMRSNRNAECVYLSLALSLAVSLVATMTHEPWIDEIYAWQISKFSVPDIFYEMRYEGHFALWSLLLYPFSHLGLPMKVLGGISWAANALALVYFVRKAPFGVRTKTLVLFTAPFLYLNPAVARCYVLIPAVLFPMASLFSKISAFTYNPGDAGNAFVSAGLLLALIANTHVYSGGFALIYGAMMLSSTLRAWTRSSKADRIKCVVGLAIGIIGALVAVLQVAPSLSHSSVFTKNDLQFSLSNLKNLGGFFIGAGITDKRAMVLVAALYILTSIYLFKEDFQSFLILLASNIYMALVCVFVYGAGVQQRAALHHDEGIPIQPWQECPGLQGLVQRRVKVRILYRGKYFGCGAFFLQPQLLDLCDNGISPWLQIL